MKFDYDYLMALAGHFEAKAEQLLETAESIRETASIMSPGQTTKQRPKKTVTQPPTPAPAAPPTKKHYNDFVDDEPPRFTPLESLIMDSLESKPAGEKIEIIVSYCNMHGNKVDKNTVKTAVDKMISAGHIGRIDLDRYALKTAFYGQLDTATEPAQWS